MIHAHFSDRLRFARFLAAIALDPERTHQFLRSPEHEMRRVGLEAEEQALLQKEDVLELFKYTVLKYQVARPSPDEQPGGLRH